MSAGAATQDSSTGIQFVHPEKADLNPGNLTQALSSAASLKVKKDIKPIVLDYDHTRRRLHVVDRGFLIWLANQDRGELLDGVGLPRAEWDPRQQGTLI